MKRIIIFALIALMTLSLAACGKKDDAGSNQNANGGSQIENNADGQDAANAGGDVNEVEACVSYETNDEGVVFTFKSKVPLKEDAWLGLCPVGVYLKEADADDVDVYYSYYFDKAGDTYKFVYDMEWIEPGAYTMVLCDTDSEGFVVAQWLFTVDSKKNFKLDFKDSVFNVLAD